MRGASWLRIKLLKRSRKAYNSGKFRKSRRLSKWAFFIFRDQENLDILARSNLRLKLYSKSSELYRKANDLGIKLLDHDKNHFNAELRSENLLNAFKISIDIKTSKEKKMMINEIHKKLLRLMDSERVLVIEKMSEIGPLPKIFVELLPWSPKKLEINEDEDDSISISRNQSRETQRMERELSRIKSSGAFQISNLITSSVRSPIKMISLPITLSKKILEIVRRRTGGLNNELHERPKLVKHKKRRDCVLFFPTNGVGFGHFTRLLAVAKSMREENPEIEIVFFTTMPTLHILAEEGFITFHMPSRYRFENMTPTEWNTVCEEMLNLVFELHRPKAFVFDGAFPYRGMLNSIQYQGPEILKIWLRRGSIKKNSKNIPVESIGLFDAIIRPADSTTEDFSNEHRHNIPIFRTDPILLHHNPEEKINLRNKLGIPQEAIVAYVQLGAGQINEIESDLNLTVDAIQEHENAYVVIGESMLGVRHSFDDERIKVLRDYPNSKYFDSFDFAVIAGGYNSYHEVVSSRLPSICYPNLETGRDDQLSRASSASSEGAMIVIRKRNREKIRISISRMMDHRVRNKMRSELSSLSKPNGSSEAAKWILNQIT